MRDDSRAPFDPTMPSASVRRRLLHLAVCCAAVLLPQGLAWAAVRRPVVETVEQVATDALAQDPRLIANAWGGHQLRIERHADGSVRALYLSKHSDTELEWHLLRRRNGRWSEEANGTSTDDVNLLRDPSSNRASVFSWASDAPLVSSSPDYRTQPVPGRWESLTSAQRHYSAIGEGPQGRVCIKTTENRRATGVTDWLYACGDLAGDRWQWDGQQRLGVGLRLAYDYLFPLPSSGGEQLLASSQLDLHRDVIGRGRLREQWVFNGLRVLRAQPARGGDARLEDSASPIEIDADATRAATLRQTDAFVDSRGRLLSTYYAEDPARRVARGFYLLVSDAAGSVRSRRWLQELPPYGYTRLYESSTGALWLLWLNKGTLASQMRLYPLTLAAEGEVKIGPPTELSEAFRPYALDGNAYLAVPRGGTPRGDMIDGLVAACETSYNGKPFDVSACYPRGGNSQRVLYFRIRLPR
jgi:hypothetical protein